MRLPATAALVGIAGIDEAITQHPLARSERRLDRFAHQLGTGGEHQQQLAFRAHAAQGRIEHDRTHRLAERGPAGFAREHRRDAMAQEMFAQAGDEGALARALAAFQGDETSAHGHGQCFSW